MPAHPRIVSPANDPAAPMSRTTKEEEYLVVMLEREDGQQSVPAENQRITPQVPTDNGETVGHRRTTTWCCLRRLVAAAAAEPWNRRKIPREFFLGGYGAFLWRLVPIRPSRFASANREKSGTDE